MSFGVGVGDFVTVGKLILDITSCLKDIGGAKSEYQDLVNELECLQKALAHIERLHVSAANPDRADSIKKTALACRRPLEMFLGKLRKYEATLGSRSTGDGLSWKVLRDKMRFGFGRSGEFRNLQGYLNGFVVTLNTLIGEQGIETTQLASETLRGDHNDIRGRLEQSSGDLRRLQSAADMQTALLEAVNKILSGEVPASFRNIQNMLAQTSATTQQIYGAVLATQTSLAGQPDIRWTFLQEPTILQDALGRKFPVPSEYSMDLLEVIIRHKFQTGPGSDKVSVGDYQILDSRNRDLVLTCNSPLRPGSSMIMSILVGSPPPTILTDETCPMPRCRSTETTAFEGGGRTCCRCGVWFDRASKERKSETNFWETCTDFPLYAACTGYTTRPNS